MEVPRHPHTGLATVTLLFAGKIDHIDSTGFSNTVKPAEVNLMIAGSGVSHSEFSQPASRVLHGVQLWYALPDALRFGQPGSQHHVADSQTVPGGRVWTYLGACAGMRSPVDTCVSVLAAQVQVEAGQQVTLDVPDDYELGVLVDSGQARVGTTTSPEAGGTAVAARELTYVAPGCRTLSIAATGNEDVRAVLIGGAPLEEQIVMWWNFVARSHDEIVAFRKAWQAEIGRAAEGGNDSAEDVEAEFVMPAEAAEMDFGPFPAGTPEALPAPRLPNA